MRPTASGVATLQQFVDHRLQANGHQHGLLTVDGYPAQRLLANQSKKRRSKHCRHLFGSESTD